MIPTESECVEILKQHKVDEKTLAHTKRSVEVVHWIIERLQEKNVYINAELVLAAAWLQDIGYLVKDTGFNHAKRGAVALRALNMPEVADVVAAHVYDPDLTPTSIEQKVLICADSHVKGANIVDIEERFASSKLKETNPKIYEEKVCFNTSVSDEVLALIGKTFGDLKSALS
jgi:hypothetical protein